MREVIKAAGSDVEAIITHPLLEDRAAAIGAATRRPVVPLCFFPVPPSRQFASPFITLKNLGPFNRLTHELALDLLWKSSRGDAAALRAELGAAPAQCSLTREAHARGLLTLLSYSEQLFPRPCDWGSHIELVGS